jgi:hypothetical protein
LVIKRHETVLLDRGGMRKLESLGTRLSGFIEKPLEKVERGG